jgi:hypothetical protein
VYDVAQSRDTGLPCRALFDTGAIDDNFISRPLAARVRAYLSAGSSARAVAEEDKLVRATGAAHMSTKVLHETGIPCALAVNDSVLHCYGIVNASVCKLLNEPKTNPIDIRDVSFKVIDMHYDMIIGRKTMRERKLFPQLVDHFMTDRATLRDEVTASPLLLRANALRSSECELRTHAANRGTSLPAIRITNLVQYGTRHLRELVDVVDDYEDGVFPIPELYCRELEDSEPSVGRLIDKIHIGGHPQMRASVRALVEEFEHIFNDRVNAEPALLPPMALSVDTAKWELPKNRGPPRPMSDPRHAIIDESTKTLLEL